MDTAFLNVLKALMSRGHERPGDPGHLGLCLCLGQLPYRSCDPKNDHLKTQLFALGFVTVAKLQMCGVATKIISRVGVTTT